MIFEISGKIFGKGQYQKKNTKRTSFIIVPSMEWANSSSVHKFKGKKYTYITI